MLGDLDPVDMYSIDVYLPVNITPSNQAGIGDIDYLCDSSGNILSFIISHWLVF